MKQRKVILITEKEFEQIVAAKPIFQNGFCHMPKVDWWGKLEEYLLVPVISVRKDLRTSWKELFIITADVYLKNNIRHLKGSLEEIKDILQEIFMEADNDEYEVFDSYAFDDLS